jgi:hypothetical protein
MGDIIIYTHQILPSDASQFKNNLIAQVCMEGSGTHGGCRNQPLAVPSAGHPPVWERIPQKLSSRVKRVQSD